LFFGACRTKTPKELIRDKRVSTKVATCRLAGETVMRQVRAMLCATALLVGIELAAIPLADAQTAPTAPATTPSANLTVQQRHIIKEIVKDLKLPAVNADVSLQAGAKVPADVSLTPMPPLVVQKVPQVQSHQLFVKDERIALVNPKDRTITEVID
jgi:hypothetical protein